MLSNTFRHPAVLAKAATVMDHATGGRFILGLGAGWHEGEHVPFGIPLPPMPERFDRFESAVHVLRALWSAEAATPPGVTRPDPFYPLDEATNEPPPLDARRPAALARRPEATRHRARGRGRRRLAPAGGRRPRRAIRSRLLQRASATRSWPRSTRSDATRRRSTIVAQVPTGTTAEDRTWALDQAREAVERGATHVILGMPAALGADGVDAVAREVAEPLREALGG